MFLWMPAVTNRGHRSVIQRTASVTPRNTDAVSSAMKMTPVARVRYHMVLGVEHRPRPALSSRAPGSGPAAGHCRAAMVAGGRADRRRNSPRRGVGTGAARRGTRRRVEVEGDEAARSAALESVPVVFPGDVRPGCASETATKTPAVAASEATAVQAVAREIRSKPSSRWRTERTTTECHAATKGAGSKKQRIGKVHAPARRVPLAGTHNASGATWSVMVRRRRALPQSVGGWREADGCVDAAGLRALRVRWCRGWCGRVDRLWRARDLSFLAQGGLVLARTVQTPRAAVPQSCQVRHR